MGFSTSGSMAILLVGVLIAVGTAYPTVSTANERVQSAVDDRNDRSLAERNSDIALVNDTYNASNDTLVIWVNNTGSGTLHVNDTDVLVDGSYRQGYESSIDGDVSRAVWLPGQTLRIEISVSPEPNRFKIVNEYGIAITEVNV
jgi:flagellar protein FlaF